MTKGPDNEPGFTPPIIIEPKAVHHTAEGSFVESDVYVPEGVAREDAERAINEATGDVEGRLLERGQTSPSTGRNMAHAAFGRWNSGWETEADRKKRENAHLN